MIKDDKPLGVVDAYVKENTTELVDPLDIKKKIESLEEKNNTLLKELDTQISKALNLLAFDHYIVIFTKIDLSPGKLCFKK